MIPSTPAVSSRRNRLAGFTLVELIVTMIIFTLILGAVLSAFLFFNKSGINVGQYVDMDRQSRQALEKFAVDIRMAEEIVAFTSTHLRVRVPLSDIPIEPEKYGATPGTYYEVDYSLSGSNFVRQVTHSDDTTVMPVTTETLVSGLATDPNDATNKALEFTRYGIGSPLSPTIPQATNVAETTQINIRLRAVRTWAAVKDTTNIVLSGRYVLRNKLN